MRRLTPPERLAQYIEANEKNARQFAIKLGVLSGTLSNWLNSKRVPGLKFALRIEKATGIEASAWDRYREQLRELTERAAA